MKAIFLVALTALLVAFVSTTPPDCGSGNGQNAIFFPNPDDCSTFYHCDRGEPLLMQCNEGLEFNPKIKVCDWPKKTVACNRRPLTTASPPHISTTTESTTVYPDTTPMGTTAYPDPTTMEK